MTTPISDAPEYPHGFVTGRYLTAVADGFDADRLMDFNPAKGRIIFELEQIIRRHEGPNPALIIQRPVVCELDRQGYLTNPLGGGRGVYLIAGIYSVMFEIEGATVPGPKRIEVKPTHTEVSPLDLILSMEEVIPPGSVTVVDETTAQRAEAAANRSEAAANRSEAVVADAESGLSALSSRVDKTLSDAKAYTDEQVAAGAASGDAAQASEAAKTATSAAEQARDAATLSQDSALSVLPMVSGSVNIAPEDGTLPVDLGRAVNTVTGLAGVDGTVDVIFPPVTTPDGRVNPDGLGTLLRVDAGADRLTWPGGTVVHGTPPEGQAAMASLVRVGGAVTVVWPPTVVTRTETGATAQIAKIEQIIGGEVEVQPGGTVLQDEQPSNGAVPAVFVNPYSRPTSSELVLSVGVINQALVAGNDFTSYATHRPGGLTDYYLQAYAALDPDSEPAKDQDGWLVAVHPGPAFTDVRVTETMHDICVRVPTSRVVMFADGTWGVIFQYDAENPLFQVYMWEGYIILSYKENGSSVPWPNGGVTTSGLRLPMTAKEPDYASLGITLPGTFHRAAEFEAMGVYPGD